MISFWLLLLMRHCARVLVWYNPSVTTDAMGGGKEDWLEQHGQEEQAVRVPVSLTQQAQLLGKEIDPILFFSPVLPHTERQRDYYSC